MATAKKKKSLTFKEPGRKPGSPNKSNGVGRGNHFHIRCSEGFTEIANELVSTGLYQSQADAAHEAMQLLALKRIPGSKWLQKI